MGTAGPEPAEAEPAEGEAGEAEAGDGEVDRDRRHQRVRSAVEWLAVIVGALAVALLVKTFLLQAFFIPSASMEPTLRVGDRVLVNKLSYRLHDVHRGDIIVFERPEGEQNRSVRDLIKRVIALPGETIEIRDNQVIIDGRVLGEPYLPPGTVTAGLDEPVTVPEGHVFVMGDNRDDSRDSRFFGAIPEDRIVGRAFVRVWPPTHLGLL